MPLSKGKSKKSFVKNLKTEMEHGKPQKQALAIAYAMKRKSKKMADGGSVKGDEVGVHNAYFDEPDTKSEMGESRAGMHAKNMQTGKSKSEWENKPHKKAAIEEHHKVLGEMKAMGKPKLKGLAEGGDVKEQWGWKDKEAKKLPSMASEKRKTYNNLDLEPNPRRPAIGEGERLQRAKKSYAEGGMTESCPHCGHYADGGDVDPLTSAQTSMRQSFKTPTQSQAATTANAQAPSPSPTPAASSNWSESDRVKAAADRNKSLYGEYAKGGEVYKPAHLMEQIHVDKYSNDEDLFTGDGYRLRPTNFNKAHVAHNGPAMHEDEMGFNQHHPDMQASTDMGEEDMVDRIMKKKSQNFSSEARFSEGGKVANQDEVMAGFAPNEFDDLHLRDDLSSSYGEDDNAGDMLGNEQEDMDRSDILSKIMKSRKKKDRMPNPA